MFVSPNPYLEIPQTLTRRGTQSFGGQFNMRGSELQKTFAGMLAEDAKKNLASRPELIERCASHRFCFLHHAFLLTPRNTHPPITKVIPAWSVSCRRLTPGPGYFEALCSDNVRHFYNCQAAEF
jgi:hypothetical protein